MKNFLLCKAGDEKNTIIHFIINNLIKLTFFMLVLKITSWKLINK